MILLIGYGNPGRGDDGLGPAAAEAIERLAIEGVRAESGYQLAIEDAAEVAEADAVIFVDAFIDAAVEGKAPYLVREVAPRAESSFSSHLLEPETLLAISRDLYGAAPRAYLVAIRGYDFGFGEMMSAGARENLALALEAIGSLIDELKTKKTSGDLGALRDLQAD